ncbi:MAG: 1-acyl-sn-glycerol-3-phosphate acyltransferase [Candidatus Marinimicrobia bacterium]|nr:1-acyl-sn-glycerol-3-phosphate acyltransferase [Candidatus Neomarinimicrobiota bacterium]
MSLLPYTAGVYRTAPRAVSWFARAFPELVFYSRYIATVMKARARIKRGQYGGDDWAASSGEVLRSLESVGIQVEITGIRHVEQLATPCVVIANHMSVLETNVLPAIIQPLRPVTFVVKQSLLDYPFFKHVMRASDPIAVNRVNPRHDLKAVLEGGTDRLGRGISIIVFPQTTRTVSFDPVAFTTIGVKLARRAGVPVIPLALLTDAWGNGKYIKEFGRIDASRKAHFAFGEPLWVQGRGADEHQAIIDFINGKLREWQAERGAD